MLRSWPYAPFFLLVTLVALAGFGSATPIEAACAVAPGWVQLTSPETALEIGGRRFPGLTGIAAGWQEPQRLYASGGEGLYSSSDCGVSWQRITVPPSPGSPHRTSALVPTVAVDRGGSIFVGGGNDPNAVSRDGGQTWQELNVVGGGKARSRSIAVSAAAEGVFYAELHLTDVKGAAGIGRSQDGGLSFEVRTFFFSGAIVVADPLETDVVYAALGGTVWRSQDGGQHFEPLARFDDGVKALSMSADGSRFWLATLGGGMYRSMDRGGGWTRVMDTPFQGNLISLSASPRDPRVLFAATDASEVWAYREPGPPDFPIPGGQFFPQASGDGAPPSTGFAVTDEGGIPFYSAFSALPLEAIGYPISGRFTYRGFTTQLFQKLALQGQPGQPVAYLNLFDELHQAGQDPWLEAFRSIPPPEDTSRDTGRPWEGVVARHLAILDGDPVLKEAYLAEPCWLEVYGLPMGYADYPTVSVVRGQRAVLQRWKVDVPWARAGEVTVANGGEIAREAGLFPAEALQPLPPP